MHCSLPPKMIDEYFESYEDCMKFNAILDMKDDFKTFELGVDVIQAESNK